ncbi:hypothetical protein [Microbacterium sp. 179-I 3D3 NHS]|uniref:hypothetical protein n=1 Tax=unclassified Microbacterium TaxID=2609290 RepID=UPI0039A2ACD1
MKHVTYGDKSHFLGDDAADTLVEYASVLGNAKASDVVTLRGIDDHGNEVEATFLLNASISMMIETTSSTMAEPDNDEAVRQMNREIAKLIDPPEIAPEERDGGGEHHDSFGM